MLLLRLRSVCGIRSAWSTAKDPNQYATTNFVKTAHDSRRRHHQYLLRVMRRPEEGPDDLCKWIVRHHGVVNNVKIPVVKHFSLASSDTRIPAPPNFPPPDPLTTTFCPPRS